MAKTILILTHQRDLCASMVSDVLNAEHIDHERFDTETFQNKVKLTMAQEPSGEISGVFRFPTRSLDFNEISVVWNRRIHDPELGVQFSEPELQEWMCEESKWSLLNALTLIPAPMVNPFEINERLKFNKWIQMKRAAELGFEVPMSKLTNEEGEIWSFWRKTNHKMVFKKIRRGIFHFRSGQTKLVHTSAIPEDKMTEHNVKRMKYCPMFLQNHIPKKYDVRSIVIGDQVFSVAIDSQSSKDGKTDYRTAAVLGQISQMKHQPIDLGSEVNRRLVAYTKSFGLVFGAIDLIITPEDNLIFLEDNPNGQWAWLEQLTGLPIARAFAEYLKGF